MLCSAGKNAWQCCCCALSPPYTFDRALKTSNQSINFSLCNLFHVQAPRCCTFIGFCPCWLPWLFYINTVLSYWVLACVFKGSWDLWKCDLHLNLYLNVIQYHHLSFPLLSRTTTEDFLLKLHTSQKAKLLFSFSIIISPKWICGAVVQNNAA